MTSTPGSRLQVVPELPVGDRNYQLGQREASQALHCGVLSMSNVLV